MSKDPQRKSSTKTYSGCVSLIMLFSIILAGYNTAPYLAKALESIRAQSFGDFL